MYVGMDLLEDQQKCNDIRFVNKPKAHYESCVAHPTARISHFVESV